MLIVVLVALVVLVVLTVLLALVALVVVTVLVVPVVLTVLVVLTVRHHPLGQLLWSTKKVRIRFETPIHYQQSAGFRVGGSSGQMFKISGTSI